MTVGDDGRRWGGPAVWLALLAVLVLLASPVLSGRARAASPGAMPAAMVMGAVTHMAADASPPCHHDGAGACASACALASQLLSPSSCGPVAPAGEAGRPSYRRVEPSPDGVWPERGAPPPR